MVKSLTKKKQLSCLSKKVNYINVFVSFLFKVFLQNDSDSKTEHQEKIYLSINYDFQLIPYYGDTFSSSETWKNVKAN